MHVQIGPVSAGSATLWIAYARTVLARALSGGRSPSSIAPETIEAFESFLDEWDEVAAAEVDFVWSAELEAEQVEYLAHTWFGLAARLAAEAEARGYPMSPPEGEEFYQALVTAVIDALAYEGRSRMEFAEQLRDEWPGLKPDLGGGTTE